LMGIWDSTCLFLPFGNDMLVVGLVARNRHGAPWYVISAAVGSTLGSSILSTVARKLGEEGIRRVAGERQYQRISRGIGNRAGLAVAVAGLAPPPFPFVPVIAAVAAIGYPIWRILVINFFARGLRFAILAVLALRYGPTVLRIARSDPFEWGVFAFILLCLVATGFSIWHWWRKFRPQGAAR
jgi:membrane protein YqaA with SNARE-associated domain